MAFWCMRRFAGCTGACSYAGCGLRAVGCLFICGLRRCLFICGLRRCLFICVSPFESVFDQGNLESPVCFFGRLVLGCLHPSFLWGLCKSSFTGPRSPMSYGRQGQPPGLLEQLAYACHTAAVFTPTLRGHYGLPHHWHSPVDRPPLFLHPSHALQSHAFSIHAVPK